MNQTAVELTDIKSPREETPLIPGARTRIAIDVTNLRKAYDTVVAVDDISIQVPEQSIFGLVGPNGAGKTTTIECIEGLRKPDRGMVRVLGMDPIRDRRKLYTVVGVQLQDNTLNPRQLVTEALRVFSSFFENPIPIPELLATCGLESHARAFCGKLSGGQKRRLLLALAIVGRPKLLILDEPTSGMDPQARFNIWSLLADLRRQGATILLTTHYMDEAEEHCDVLCMIDHGNVIRVGAPRQLLIDHRIEWCAKLPVRSGIDAKELAGLPGITTVEEVDHYYLVYGMGKDFAARIDRVLRGHGVVLDLIETRNARLEDLYLLLTGRAYRKE